MKVVPGLSPETLAGPKPGFVVFRFEKSITESIGVRIPIQGCSDRANAETGEELFPILFTEP